MATRKRTSAAERVLRRVDVVGDCWIFTGALSHGYGDVRMPDGGTRRAHRVVWEAEHGPVPDGLQLDHLCRNRACVNPAHLEPVTPSENTRRGLAPLLRALQQRAKTHCPQGHPYDEANTYVAPRPKADRQCRSCRRINEKRRRELGNEN